MHSLFFWLCIVLFLGGFDAGKKPVLNRCRGNQHMDASQSCVELDAPSGGGKTPSWTQRYGSLAESIRNICRIIFFLRGGGFSPGQI